MVQARRRGFRLERWIRCSKIQALRDNPTLPGTNKFGDPDMDANATTKSSRDSWSADCGLRKVADEYDAVLIGETWTKNIDELKRILRRASKELQMPMDLMFTRSIKLSRAANSAARSPRVNSSGGWPVFVFSNHDIIRS